MGYDIKPSSDICGGMWYQDGELMEKEIQELCSAAKLFLVSQKGAEWFFGFNFWIDGFFVFNLGWIFEFYGVERKHRFFHDICNRHDDDLSKSTTMLHPDAFRFYVGNDWKKALDIVKNRSLWDELTDSLLNKLAP